MRNLAELNINEGGKPVMRRMPTEAEFASFEARYQVKFPEDLKQLLRYSNGGHPELSSVKAADPEHDLGLGVNHFRHLSPDNEGTRSLAYGLEEWRPILGKKALPFASNGGGDEFFLDLSDTPSSVKICLHDERMAIAFVAPSFEAFIDGLYLDPDLE